MRSVRKVVQAGLFCSALLGCGGESLTGSQARDVVGTWHATKAQVTSVANSATTMNLITGGLTLQVVFDANLTYVSTTTFPGESPEVTTGTYTASATKLTLSPVQNSSGDVWAFDLAISNGALVLTGATIQFDFGAGDVASKLDLTLAH